MNEAARKLRRQNDPDALASKPQMDTARSVISIFLFIQLFVVFVCLSANFAPSTAQQRLLRFFQPYTQLLNFELDGTRYFLTHATIRDVDHRIEILPNSESDSSDNSWQTISRGLQGSERYHRYQRLADTMAFFQEDEATTALIAEAVAHCYASQQATTVGQLRCRQHTLQSWEALDSPIPEQNDPQNPVYFAVIYRANVLTTSNDQIRILKRAEAALEAAPNRRADGSMQPGKDSPRRTVPGVDS